jgi:GAF domain-containing protein
VSDDPGVTSSVEELTEFFVGDKTMLDTLHRVASLAVAAVESATFASVTTLFDGEPRTGVFTHPDAPEIDQAQYDSGEGPCLDAFRTGEIYRIACTRDDGPWPAFRAACRERGILSTASLPLVVDDVRHGALNMYAATEQAFGSAEVRLAESFAAQAGVVIAYARSYWSARQASQHLESALVHRAEIEQAKGIIIATTGVSADSAFEMLVRQSQHENRKLRDIAVELVNSKVQRTPDGSQH